MKAKPRPVSSRRRILTLPLRRWLSRTGSACSFRPRPEYRGRRATREARVSCSGPSRARRGDDDARLETRECESGDGVTGRACAGWGGLGQDAVRASDGSFKARGKERGKKRTFDRSRAGASPRSRVRRDSIAAAGRERGKMRANANPPSRGSAPRVGSRASAPSAGRCSEKVHSHSGVAPRHLANDQVEGSDGARTGRVKTWGSSGRGGFGRCGVLREFVRARWVRACVRVAWSAARRPRPRPAVVAKKISRFLYVFALAHGKQSFVQNFEKPSRNLFIFGNFGADREKKRIKGLLIGFPSDFIDRALHSWGELIGSCFTRGFCRGF